MFHPQEDTYRQAHSGSSFTQLDNSRHIPSQALLMNAGNAAE